MPASIICVEVIGAMKAYGAVAQDPELLAKVSFTASTVCSGKVSEVVARCKNVWQAATDNAAALVNYGVRIDSRLNVTGGGGPSGLR